MKNFHDVIDAEMARVLTDLTQLRLITRFFDEATLSEVSKDLKIKMTTLKKLGVNIELKQMDKKTESEDTPTKPDDPAILSGFGFLELDFANAKALEKDLEALIKTYEKKQLKNAQSYIYRIGLTPVLNTSFEPKD